MVAFAQTGDTMPDCKESLGQRNSLISGGDRLDEAKKDLGNVRRKRQRRRSRKKGQKDLHDKPTMAAIEVARDEEDSRATCSMNLSTPVKGFKQEINSEAGALIPMAKVCSTTLRGSTGSVRAHESKSRPTCGGDSALSPSAVTAQQDTVQEPVATRFKPFTKRVRRTRRKCQPQVDDASGGSVVIGVSQELGPGQEANNSAKPNTTATIAEVIENNKPHDSIVGQKPKKTKNSRRDRGAKNHFQLTSPLSIEGGDTLQRQGPTPLKQPSLHRKNSATFKSSPPSAQSAEAITIYNGNTTTKLLGSRRGPRSRRLATPKAPIPLSHYIAQHRKSASLSLPLPRSLSGSDDVRLRSKMQNSKIVSYVSTLDSTVKTLQGRYGRRAATSVATTDHPSPPRDMSLHTESPGQRLDLRSDITSPSYQDNVPKVIDEKPPKCQLVQYTTSNGVGLPMSSQIATTDLRSMAGCAQLKGREHETVGAPNPTIPEPLGENNVMRNKKLQQPIRADKPTYVPPHLRRFEKSEDKVDQISEQKKDPQTQPEKELKIPPTNVTKTEPRPEFKSEWKPRKKKGPKCEQKTKQGTGQDLEPKTEQNGETKPEAKDQSSDDVQPTPKAKKEIKNEQLIDQSSVLQVGVNIGSTVEPKNMKELQPKTPQKVKPKSEQKESSPPHLRWASVVQPEKPGSATETSVIPSSADKSESRSNTQSTKENASRVSPRAQDEEKDDAAEQSTKWHKAQAESFTSRKDQIPNTDEVRQSRAVPNGDDQRVKDLQAAKPIGLTLEQKFGHLLPENLRNIPEPKYLRPKEKPKPVRLEPERDTETILLQAHEDAAQIADSLKDSKVPLKTVATNTPEDLEVAKATAEIPTFKVRPLSQLGLELAAAETLPKLVVVEDCSDSILTQASVQLSSDGSPRPQQKSTNVWRWFNQDVFSTTSEDPKKKLEYEVAAGGLAGWDGDWAPAPVEWDARGQFINNDRRHIRFMENWMDKQVEEALERPFIVYTSSPGFASGIIPASGTRKQLQDRPDDCIFPRVQLHYGAIDWEAVETLPPNDPYSQTPERLKQTSLTSSKVLSKKLSEERKQERENREALRVDYIKSKSCKEPIPLEYIPKANIYIRPVVRSDLRQITDIYNHYVEHTIHADELEKTNENDWLNRLQNIDEESFAFLVAVAKSAKVPRGRDVRDRGSSRVDTRNGRGRNGNQRRPGPLPETILGFAYAEDFAGRNTIYRYTAEIRLYVHPGNCRLGVGKTLMDRIIPSLDQGYVSRGATDFVADCKNHYEVGGKREIRKVITHICYRTGEEKDFEWKKKWLEENWEFDHIGTMRNVGVKAGGGIHMASMVLETNQVHGCSTWFQKEPDRIPHREVVLRRKAEKEERLKNMNKPKE